MKTVLSKNRELKETAENLFRAGKTQKEIAEQIGITEKTVGVWLKPFKSKVLAIEKAETGIIKRINEALERKAPPTELKELAYSLTMIRASK